MGSEVKSNRVADARSVSVGERVTLADSETEYVVVNVDHATGQLELLRLNPGRIEGDIPISAVRKRTDSGPRLATEEHD
jgi:hypothetical protein